MRVSHRGASGYFLHRTIPLPKTAIRSPVKSILCSFSCIAARRSPCARRIADHLKELLRSEIQSLYRSATLMMTLGSERKRKESNMMRTFLGDVGQRPPGTALSRWNRSLRRPASEDLIFELRIQSDDERRDGTEARLRKVDGPRGDLPRMTDTMRTWGPTWLTRLRK